MSNPAEIPRRPTYADIEALPDHVVGEILAGELFVSPRPAPPHALASSALGFVLGPPFALGRGGPGGWWILDEPELSPGVDPDYDPVVPNLAGWTRERLPRMPETAQYEVVPDWVCEVLSPSTAQADRALKLPFYGRAGVRYAWIVDPLAHTVEVYVLDGEGWRLGPVVRGREEVSLAPFEAITWELAELWGPTD